MTFDPGMHPDPAALQQAVRDTDFTPTDIRFWVQGTLEREQVSGADDPGPVILVSTGSGQRFALAPTDGSGARDALLGAGAATATVWGTVTESEDTPERTLHVEGHTVDAP